MDRGAWRTAVHGVTKSAARRSSWTTRPPLWWPHTCFCVCDSVSVLQISSFVPFFRIPHVSGNTYLSFSFYLTHIVWQPLGPCVTAQCSRSVSADSPWPHGLLPCPSPTPGAYSDSCPPSQWCHPTISSSVVPFSSCLQSFPVFSNQSALLIRWPKYWSFSFSNSTSNEYSGLISFRMDRFDLLASQGILKSLLQHHSSKASILQWSAFLMVQLSHPYMTTGKTIALTIQTFVSRVMSLLFNTLFRFVIAFLPRSKCLLISWLQSHPQWFWSPRK